MRRVGLIVLNLLIWHYNKVLGLTIFLLISSYHFGETQLFHLNLKKKILTHFTYLIWGSSVLFTFVFYNTDEFVDLSDLVSLSGWNEEGEDYEIEVVD